MNHARERRRHHRVYLKIHVRGVLIIKGVPFDFAAHTVELSTHGLQIQLNEDSSRRLGDILGESEIGNCPAEVKIISYIEENLRIRGKVVHHYRGEDAERIGMELCDLTDSDLKIIKNIQKKRPDLMKETEKQFVDYHFKSMEDFVGNVTRFIIDTEKQEDFWINGRKYFFTGMHKTKTDEIHIDCIAMADDVDTIFCPDCRNLIDKPNLM